MNILIVNTTAHTGGASIAAGRLANALKASGHEVRLLVRDDKRLINRWRFVWERLTLLYANGFDRKNVFAIDDGCCGSDITQTPEFRWADVIHLHWINQAMMGLEDLEHLFRRSQELGKKIVWTLHDIWPASSICHLPGACEGWQHGCGNCPLLHRHALTRILPRCGRSADDLSARVFRRKQELYRLAPITFVACSKYLEATVRRSPLLQGQQVVSIANPLDTQFFSPATDLQHRLALRQQLGLPLHKRLVLFVSYNVTDENKGFRFVVSAVECLLAERPVWQEQLAIVPVGKNATQYVESFACEVCPFEYVGERETMRDLYRAADLLVVSSLMENLPNTIVEAKACGLPVVATRVGGIPQMLRHKEDGFLCAPQSPESLTEGLAFVLEHPDYAQLSRAAREEAVSTYSEANVVQKYVELYD